MKVYISADIEGVTGILQWAQATKGDPSYPLYATRMTDEVMAACKGAKDAGAHAVYVRDAHDSACNLDIDQLPQDVTFISGFNDHPACMLFGLDDTFDAVILIGYHSPSGSAANPLSHTMSTDLISFKVNGQDVGEFELHAMLAAKLGVPIVFVSGDTGLTASIKKQHPTIETVSTNHADGATITYPHPAKVRDAIKAGVTRALQALPTIPVFECPDGFVVEMTFTTAVKAYRASQYPNMTACEDLTVRYAAESIIDVLRMIQFTLF